MRLRLACMTALIFSLLYADAVEAQTGSTIIRNVSRGSAANGKVIAEQCASCHGHDGISPIDGFPHLAGQNFNYLVKQLREMRNAARERTAPGAVKSASENTNISRNQRSNETMDPFVVDLTDEAIIDLSAYYSGLACTLNPKANVPEPPKIAVRCQVCHGKAGVTKNRNMPNIAGQNRIYTSLQLQYFREAARANADPNAERRRAAIMESQAASLSDADIDELSAYYSALPCAN